MNRLLGLTISLLLLGAVVWTLGTFVFIWIYGSATIYEGNLWIRGWETAALIGVAVLSLYGIYKFGKAYLGK